MIANRIVRFLKRIFFESIKIWKTRNIWLNLNSNPHSNLTNNVHMLVVKNIMYIDLARICIESFLHYHPKTKIIVHCDSQTIDKMRKGLRATQKRRPGSIILLLDTGIESWQIKKLKLLLSLMGTSDFFMDADIRWNGVIKKIQGLTFFVQEFYLKENSIYSKFLENLSLNSEKNYTMKNTSFFCWNNLSLNSQTLDWIDSILLNISSISKIIGFSESEKNEIYRIQEQLIISLATDQSDMKSFFLKNSDKQFDGGLAESSYFGATGSRFSKFGITKRKI